MMGEGSSGARRGRGCLRLQAADMPTQQRPDGVGDGDGDGETGEGYRTVSVTQKKRPRIRRPMPWRSYKMLNLLTNWFMVLQVLVMVPRYAIKPTSLH